MGIEIHVADCMNFMQKWRGRKADIVVTSPPYNIGKKYASYGDNLSDDGYMQWMRAWGKRVADILADDGSLFLNVGYTAKNPTMPFDVLDAVSESLVVQNVIHWIKSMAIPERDFNVGHYQPLNSDKYLSLCHEYVFHFSRRGDVCIDKASLGVPYTDQLNITRFMGTENRDRGNVWFVPYETRAGRHKHPATFPVGLPKMCIRLHGIRRDMLVYDPFMGSGSTAVACKNLGVDCVGTDIDPGYVDMALLRTCIAYELAQGSDID